MLWHQGGPLPGKPQFPGRSVERPSVQLNCGCGEGIAKLCIVMSLSLSCTFFRIIDTIGAGVHKAPRELECTGGWGPCGPSPEPEPLGNTHTSGVANPHRVKVVDFF